MSCKNSHRNIGLQIELIDVAEDFSQAFDCVCEAFGEQAEDGIWIAMNPGWGSPEGKKRGASRMMTRWHNMTKDNKGNLNTMFLKATVPNPEDARIRLIVGFAIWAQASSVEGYGELQPDDLEYSLDVEDIYPGNESEQRYLRQAVYSLHRRRREVIEEKRIAHPPAVFVLDICAVHPAHQRKGIAKQLVKWGLAEAQRRGNLEAITEASTMGRHVYEQLGFEPEGVDIEYSVDSEFASRKRPANIFMRARASNRRDGIIKDSASLN